MDYLVDTNILIDYLRGAPQAAAFFRQARRRGKLWVSVISVAELYLGQGTKQAREAAKVKRLLRLFRIAHLDGSAAAQGGAIARDYNLDFRDALIAATALSKGLLLITRNIKHFSPIPKLAVHQPY